MYKAFGFRYIRLMKASYFLLIPATLLMSCGGESESTAEKTDSLKTDTTALMAPNVSINVNSLLAKYTIHASAPLLLDTTYLAEMELNDSALLSADEIRFLSYNFVENDLSYSGKSSIDDALFFDSLKAAGGYEGYVEVLDLGMMKDANAYAAQKVTLDDTTSLLLWYVDFGTYEACPYFSGKTLYASIFRNNEVRASTLIGENSGGGDAPYWSETMTSFSIENGTMKTVKTDRNGGETDEEGNELVSESTVTYELRIVNGTWEVTEAVAE